MLNRHDAPTAAGNEVTYSFQASYMQRTAKRRLLVVHRDKLRHAVADSQERQKSQVRKVFLEKMMGAQGTSGGGAGKSGWLTVRKNMNQKGRSFFRRKAQEWKRRWVRMEGMELRMYKEEATGARTVEPVQIVPLERAQADVVPPAVLGKENCFRYGREGRGGGGCDVVRACACVMRADPVVPRLAAGASTLSASRRCRG